MLAVAGAAGVIEALVRQRGQYRVDLGASLRGAAAGDVPHPVGVGPAPQPAAPVDLAAVGFGIGPRPRLDLRHLLAQLGHARPRSGVGHQCFRRGRTGVARLGDQRRLLG